VTLPESGECTLALKISAAPVELGYGKQKPGLSNAVEVALGSRQLAIRNPMQLGANYLGGSQCEFLVWAPWAEQLTLQLLAPQSRTLPMQKTGKGLWRLLVDQIPPGADYRYRIEDALERPDPASGCQPAGVHGPSRVVDHAAFAWTDRDWQGLPEEELVIYELHVGTFTPEGTFDAVVPRLAELRELGITAIELMPVAQFPGKRNWGYDGTCPFAVQNSYGGPDGLKRLVDACHDHGLAVVLDVVYNHLGPEGNYLRDFGPYFTDRYRTPWGEAVNFDGAGSDGVRRYFIENALHWLDRYHIDALRLDAVHAIYDFSAKPFLQELAEVVAAFAERTDRRCLLIAESDLNDVRLIRPPQEGGFGLEAQWNDDFHHALHTLLTGETQAYYADFGAADDLAKAFREGFVYSWRYSAYRQRRHGSSSADRPGRQLVVFSQNHDQVGNRPVGERLIALAGFEAAKLAAASVLFAPAVPLLFMGEEYGEEAPFLYFVDFEDTQLQEAVRRGRREEFRGFDWPEAPPDPQDPETFRRSQLAWAKRLEGRHAALREFYRQLFRLRRELPALASLDKQALKTSVLPEQKLIVLERHVADCRLAALLNFGRDEAKVRLPEQNGRWCKLLDSADSEWRGPGSSLPEAAAAGREVAMAPLSAALYRFQP